eukprot:COSAG02_NODE_46018_length_352_cov_0.996047_1_plen_81_part_01
MPAHDSCGRACYHEMKITCERCASALQFAGSLILAVTPNSLVYAPIQIGDLTVAYTPMPKSMLSAKSHKLYMQSNIQTGSH